MKNNYKELYAVNKNWICGKYYNFSEGSVKLTQYNLTESSQAVPIGEVSSKAALLNIGIPQGSIVGLILFLIFVND